MKVYGFCTEGEVSLLTPTELEAFVNDCKAAMLESGYYEKEEMDYIESTTNPREIFDHYFGEDEYDLGERTL